MLGRHLPFPIILAVGLYNSLYMRIVTLLNLYALYKKTLMYV